MSPYPAPQFFRDITERQIVASTRRPIDPRKAAPICLVDSPEVPMLNNETKSQHLSRSWRPTWIWRYNRWLLVGRPPNGYSMPPAPALLPIGAPPTQVRGEPRMLKQPPPAPWEGK